MHNKMKSLIRELIKKVYICIRKIGLLWADVRYKGKYSSWKEAELSCKGYDAAEIFQKVKQSTLSVINGEAAFERDGVLFYERQYNYPLLSYLLAIEKEYQCLNIIDWGGSLGSTYFQNRQFLDEILEKYTWTVIEQEHFIEFGKKSIYDNKLVFRYSLSDINNIGDYTCIIFSSVLQYLDFAEELCYEVTGMRIPYIIIERQPVSTKDILTVEYVKEPIYNASYPIHFFAEEAFCELFTRNGYQLIDTWHSMVDSDVWIGEDIVTFKSFVFKLA